MKGEIGMNNIKNLKCWLQQNRNKIAIFFFSLGGFVALLSSQICIVFTTSESIPYSVCLQIYHLVPQKGDLCAFNFSGKKFIKYVFGTAGDRIKNVNGVIYVGEKRIGLAQKTEYLTPVENGVVPEGYIFVSGTHPDSLDSRYQEFGLVKLSEIKGKVFGWLHHMRLMELCRSGGTSDN